MQENNSERVKENMGTKEKSGMVSALFLFFCENAYRVALMASL